jgi:hypothetical protein
VSSLKLEKHKQDTKTRMFTITSKYSVGERLTLFSNGWMFYLIALMSDPINAMSSCTSVATALRSSILNYRSMNFSSNFTFFNSRWDTFTYVNVNNSRRHRCTSSISNMSRIETPKGHFTSSPTIAYFFAFIVWIMQTPSPSTLLTSSM